MARSRALDGLKAVYRPAVAHRKACQCAAHRVNANHPVREKPFRPDPDGRFVIPRASSVPGWYVRRLRPVLASSKLLLIREHRVRTRRGHNRARVDLQVRGPLTHRSYWDKDGNLYAQDWNVSGRLRKLVKVKQARLY